MKVVKALIAVGGMPLVLQKNAEGETVFHMLSCKASGSLIEYLLAAAGGDTKLLLQCDNHLNTPLHRASSAAFYKRCI